MPNTEQPRASMDSISPELDAISERLVTARLNAEALPEFPGELPDTLDGAYAIQSLSIGRWPDAVAGWKVGMVPESYRPHLAAERLTGPIFGTSIFEIEPGSTRTMPIFEGGFAAVEAEFLFRLRNTIEPSSRSWSDAELVEIVAAMHVGAEIASSPMAAINDIGPCCVVSDFGNNAGLLVGPSVPDWSSRPLDSLLATVTVDDVVVGAASADAIDGGLLQALRFLLQVCAGRGIVLPEGTYVSTGASTGIHDVHVGSIAGVDFAEFGEFYVAFESMTPKQ